MISLFHRPAVAGDEGEGAVSQGAGLQPVCKHPGVAEGEAAAAGLRLPHHLWLHDPQPKIQGVHRLCQCLHVFPCSTRGPLCKLRTQRSPP